MMQFFKKPNFDFMKLTKYTVGGSFAFIAVALAIFAIRFMNNRASVLAVDLTGGTSIVYNLKQDAKPAVADIRAALNDFDNATVIQYQDGGVGDSTLLVKTGETAETKKGSQLEGKDVGAYVTKLLREKFPQAEIAPASVDEVGSMVGADLKKSGSYAVLFSLVAILIYVGFRFQFGFGLGALVALAHDALISLAIFSLCGRQVSLIVITALLTIIGYSVNDTVVVFDRIREQLRHDRRMTFAELCNRRVRPHPRAAPPRQAHDVRRALQQRGQRLPRPYGHHVCDDVLRHPRALRVRRRLDLRLRAHDAHRRRRGHLLVRLHRDPGHDVVVQGQAPRVRDRGPQG